MKPNHLNTPFTLPCGVTLANRLVKAAMTERISDRHLQPTANHQKLYDTWANTGAGLLITGNVMIDRTHLESSGNICIDESVSIPSLSAWANAAKKSGNHVWVQISHAGRQTNKFSSSRPLAPSEVQLKKIGLFGKPVAMTEEDIQSVIQGFIQAARIAKQAGFTGVQIHSAHGYLLSQFLSPKTNTRSDRWGGSIENRSRLLLTILREVRKEVGAGYPVSVKLNSADFQKGGFTEEDSLEVVKMLDREKIDLLEISGGTYENVAFFLMNDIKTSTRQREAFFMDFAKKVRSVSTLPLMITGGFRSREFCNEVLENGELDFIGMARPFLTNLANMAEFLKGSVQKLDNRIIRTGIKQFDDAAEGGYYARQIIRLSKGKKVSLDLSPMWSSNFLVLHELRKAVARKLFS